MLRSFLRYRLSRALGGVSSASRGHGIWAYGRPAGEAGEVRHDRRLQPPPRREGETEAVRGGAQPAGLQEATRSGKLKHSQGEVLCTFFTVR